MKIDPTIVISVIAGLWIFHVVMAIVDIYADPIFAFIKGFIGGAEKNRIIGEAKKNRIIGEDLITAYIHPDLGREAKLVEHGKLQIYEPERKYLNPQAFTVLQIMLLGFKKVIV